MNKTILLVACIMVLMLSKAQSQQHPIDSALSICLASFNGSTTAGMLQCSQKAYQNWDAELNNVYGLLLDSVKGTTIEVRLKETQKAWIQHRDKEFAFTDHLYLSQRGSMYKVMAASYKTEFVKERTLELEHLFQIIYSNY